jgi:thioesterase domain-containing protein
MLPVELERFLQDHIPLSKAMQVTVLTVKDESVVLRAPLAPNINHRETVFGGSASALAILSAWSLLKVRLSNAGIVSRLVIQRNTMDYLSPIQGEFVARATLLHPQGWQKFIHTLTRKNKARIVVSSEVEHQNQIVGRLTGEFVALRV